MVDGKPNFFEVQRRTLMSNSFRIELAATKYPASFVAFDILYYDNNPVVDLPLMERKKLLKKAVKSNDRIAVSMFVEEKGKDLYNLAENNGLEGTVAKLKNSKYYFDKRTKEWIKIKNLKDDDFVICGYIRKEKNVASLVLGQYHQGRLVYKGHVTLGVSGEDFKKITSTRHVDPPFSPMPKGNEDAVWIKPVLIGVVKYMEKTESGSLRQPVFKGLRDDKNPIECKDN